MMALLLTAVMAKADGLAVRNVLVQQGGTATVQVELNNTENDYRAVLFDLTLPDGVTVVYDEYGDAQITKGSRLSAKYSVTANHLENGSDRFGIINTTDDEVIAGEDGTLFSFTIAASGDLTPGSVLTADVSAIKLTDADATDHVQDAFTFDLTVEEVRTILDETSATMPEPSDGAVDVRLNRTLKAGEWSTIVLPFTAMGSQVKAAFGEDVELAAFTAWESEEDEDDAIVGINVSFATATAITANTPMLIKTTADVTTAPFDGVTIEPEAEPMVQVGRKASERGYFHGTYIPAKVPAENLFLSGNKFWYSTGKTNIKGYRGYFEFRDVLDAYYDAAAVKVNLFIDGAATHIDQMVNGQSVNGKWYDLSGRQMVNGKWSNGQIRKGVYIVNGKKVTLK